MPTIAAVLFDADGVLQHAPHDWVDALDAVGGEGFAEAVFDHEASAMRGDATMRDCLQEAARSFGAQVDVEAVLDLWRRFTVDDEALAVVARVRAAEVPVYLATNQQDVRRDVMRERYAGVFDGSFYSCDVGAAKPSSEFFEHAVATLGRPADSVLFIDDSERNVEAARACGLRAIHHDPESGAAGIVRAMIEFGAIRDGGVEVRRRSTHRSMPWRNGAGITHEVARHDLGDTGEFGWRASFAEVEAPGPFSAFPCVDRIITLVEGQPLQLDVTSAADGSMSTHVLRRHEPFGFAGEDVVDATPDGPTIDFNVMTARGRCTATVDTIVPGHDLVEIGRGEQVILACVGGAVTIDSSVGSVSLTALDVAFPTRDVTLSGDGSVLVVRINAV